MNQQGDVSHTFTPRHAKGSDLDASVIIPVYNGAQTIETSLQALAQQTIAPHRYEIIVVDDGSTDDIAATVREWSEAHPSIHCTLVRQTNQGPAAARNRGAQVAVGTILLFTDADCCPTRNWIEQLISVFDNTTDQLGDDSTQTDTPKQISAAMGAYRSKQQSSAARFAQLEFEQRYAHMGNELTIDVVATYSAAFRRTIFADAKGFDPSFPKANNEDVELSYRLNAAGHRMVFVPDAIVYHTHDTTWWDYARTKFWRAYWRTIVYKRYPAKALKDSYTPQTLKIQIVLAPFCVLAICGYLLTQDIRLLLLLVPFLLTTLPMMGFALRQGKPRLAPWTPWGLWLRSIVFGLGVIMAILFSNHRGHVVESAISK